MVVVAAITAAMIIVLSALNGIEELVEELFSKFDTELTIIPDEGKVFTLGEDTLAMIAAMDGVSMISEVIEEEVWVRNNAQDVNVICTMKGVQPYYGKMSGLDSTVHFGDFTLEQEDFYYAVPGYGIFSDLKLPHRESGDPSILIINAPIRGKKLSRHKEKAFNSMPIMVRSTYSVNAQMDVKYIFTSINFCRELFDYPTQMTSLEITIPDESDIDLLKSQIQALVGNQLIVQTREDKKPLVYKTNQSEKWATFLILLFILIIAAFNIIASLSMLVIEKKKDIFILRSMGAQEKTIRRIFIQVGVMIYFVGSIVGLVFGIIVVWLQQTYKFIEIKGASVPYYPVKIIGNDLVIILICVMTIGLLFSNVLVRHLLKRYVN